MTGIDAYLQALRRELARRFIHDPLAIEEAHAHLTDATAAAVARGATPHEAETCAVARFGAPAQVADAFDANRMGSRYRVLLVVALLAGGAIAWVDGRPTWDDTGITASALLLTAMGLSVIAPRHAWRWSLALGLWLPASALIRTPSVAALSTALALLPPLAGSAIGRLARRLAAAN